MYHQTAHVCGKGEKAKEKFEVWTADRNQGPGKTAHPEKPNKPGIP